MRKRIPSRHPLPVAAGNAPVTPGALAQRHGAGQQNGAGQRKGSVLLVVVGMLGLLLLLGFMFFSFASYEQSSAQAFSEAAKVREPMLSTENLWDWALEQLIVGPNSSVGQSALYDVTRPNAYTPTRHSMIGTLIGNQFGPYAGEGIHLMRGPNGQPQVDQNHDNVADTNQELLDFNLSPAARGGYTVPGITMPGPGVDYTYPDQNNFFVSYIGKSVTTGKTIIIPSFHRWTMLRDGTGYISDWATNTATAKKVFRPHPEHTIPGSGGVKRFTSAFPFALTPDVDGPYDVDLDGDGLKEAIYLDLGYPVQELPDGRKYQPIFSFTVMDLDGLVNMNTGGNLAKYNSDLSQAALSVLLSGSNQGTSASEVNPAWVLSAVPPAAGDATLKPHKAFFGYEPTDRIQLANMEMIWMQWGRVAYDTSGNVTDAYPGRYGDRQRLLDGMKNGTIRFYHPEPGAPGVDDDGDQYAGEVNTALGMYPFVHPLDYKGQGVWLANLKQPRFYTVGAHNWLQYVGYQNRGNVLWGRGLAGYPQQYYLTIDRNGNPMFPANLSNQNFDHPNEVVVAPNDPNSDDQQEFKNDNDATFGPDFTEQMVKSPGDPDNVLINSPGQSLMPYNLNNDPGDTATGRPSALERRKMLTAHSADRRQHAVPHFYGQRPWEFNADIDADGDWDSNSDGTLDDANGDGSTVNGAGMEFPPVSALSSRGTLNALEAIRPELRKWLHIEQGNTTNGERQGRWDPNKLLSSTQNDSRAYSTGNVNIRTQYQQMTPYERKLTPHASALTTSAPILSSSVTAQNASAPTDLEFWARRDRQQMARDIYTMLYLFCGGQDSVNYARTANSLSNPPGTMYPLQLTGANGYRPVYTTGQCYEMAQFAVNCVDNLDTDDVITRFEFDMDLSDGWNLDDNPTTGPDPVTGVESYIDSIYSSVTATPQRGVVYGVEAQHLSLNEILVFKYKRVEDEIVSGTYKDHPATEFNDADVANPLNPYRYYSYVELINNSPFTVYPYSAYQVQLIGQNPITVTDTTRNLTLTLPNTQTVAAGSTFTIGARSYVSSSTLDHDSSSNPLPSYFRIDPNWDKTVTAPAMVTIAPAGGSLSVDLTDKSFDTSYSLTDSSGTAQSRGGFVEVIPNDPTIKPSVDFVLRRRLHPRRTAPTSTAEEADNPWVTIDTQSSVVVRTLADPSGTLMSLRDPNHTYGMSQSAATDDIQPALRELTSSERREPLDRTATLYNTALGTNHIYNSLGLAINKATGGGTFQLWQPHFDRDYANAWELLSVPLYGQDTLTSSLGLSSAMHAEFFSAFDSKFARLAQSKIYRPDWPDGSPMSDLSGDGSTTAGENLQADNRWYRLFEFVEVGTRMLRQKDQNGKELIDKLPSPVVYGKVDLNMIRHRQVLHALLDEPNLFNITNNYYPDITEVGGNAGRQDWFRQFIISRDGWDPTSGEYVPGMAGSRPFRAMSYVGDGYSVASPIAGTAAARRSIENTILRSLPLDYEDFNHNGTLDAPGGPGTGEDVNGDGLLTKVDGSIGPNYARPRRLFETGQLSGSSVDGDPYVDQRLLAKLGANSTNRSHLFACWIGVDFFEVTMSGSNAQVGAKLPAADAKSHRMLCIIDRSQLEKAYDVQKGRFNFKPLVIYQRTIE